MGAEGPSRVMLSRDGGSLGGSAGNGSQEEVVRQNGGGRFGAGVGHTGKRELTLAEGVSDFCHCRMVTPRHSQSSMIPTFPAAAASRASSGNGCG